VIGGASAQGWYSILTYELGHFGLPSPIKGRGLGPDTALPKPVVPFCRAHSMVLDCANGYQKENQEEVDEIEENRN
jgi:hypothetical protein